MNRNLNQGSAKIYQFPAGGRAALGARHCGDTNPTADQKSPPVSEAISASSWYHEEAIRESRPTWKPSWEH